MKWAVLSSDNRVMSIVESNPPDGAVKAPDGSGVAVGRVWNGWTFDAPKWSSYEFLLRFTRQERTAVRAAGLNDPMVEDFLFLATAAHEISADDPNTVAGMEYLVSSGIITETRKQEILS
jgi:hypothetical protein